ncbi:hypothetical protein AFCDBAGC_4613 [Methylobacterium cerastii]|uniref:Uncharacterized protein n=1 Tax=Methylobacterium cerastii TaxID=932741 RepID=A0ABQ4QPR8_9HYPH|nr:hypothetical protein [Methylobacterium cerastii]GJD46729.1 hypothetical protein AFCDBAGC_4613 [Methylobacterium cerastii]
MSTTITSDLLKAKIVTDDEVNAAVDVFMKDATVNLFRFASGHTMDPAASVKAYKPARGGGRSRPDGKVSAGDGADRHPARMYGGFVSDDPCQEAADVLRTIGWKVEPAGDDLGSWLVDGEQLGHADLMALARLIGLIAGPELIQ